MLHIICRECLQKGLFRNPRISTTRSRHLVISVISRHVDTPASKPTPLKTSVNPIPTIHEASTSQSTINFKSDAAAAAKRIKFDQTTLSVIMASLLVLGMVTFVTGRFVQEVTVKFEEMEGTIFKLFTELRETQKKLADLEERNAKNEVQRTRSRSSNGNGSWWRLSSPSTSLSEGAGRA